MDSNSNAINKIDKEKISSLNFAPADVLTTSADQLQRKIDLQRASALGASSKANVKIYFIDDKGITYRTEATVWASTEKNVTLKGEVLIPIRAITKVGFF